MTNRTLSQKQLRMTLEESKELRFGAFYADPILGDSRRRRLRMRGCWDRGLKKGGL